MYDYVQLVRELSILYDHARSDSWLKAAQNAIFVHNVMIAA